MSIATLDLFDFSGGTNLRDAPTELAPNETPFARNVTLDERGGAEKRLGLEADGSAQGADLVGGYYSNVLGGVVFQAGTDVKLRTAPNTYTTLKTFTTAARVGMVDFHAKFLMLHPVDGLFSYPSGGPVSARLASPLVGSILAAWQNRVFASGMPTEPTRFVWSNSGDETTFDLTNNTNEVRDVNDDPITALSNVGRPGLLIFKKRSTHRVTDSFNGEYQTLDVEHGAAGPLAVVAVDGRVCSITEDGIFITDGTNPLSNVAGKLEPLFRPSQLALSALDKWCAGQYRDRFVFSLRRAGKTANDLTIEFHPQVGWNMVHDFGASFFATHSKDDHSLFVGAPGSARKLYLGFKTGADDGVAIASAFQTRWLQPNGLYRTNYRRVRMAARGNFSFYKRFDFSLGDELIGDLSFKSSGVGRWDVGDTWDSGLVWGPSQYEYMQDLWNLGVGQSASFIVRESSSLVGTAPTLLGDGIAAEIGAWSLYGLQLDHIRLGYA